MNVRGMIGGAVLAVAVPGLALACADVPLFGWPRIMVVHLLAGLPLAIGIGVSLATRRRSEGFFGEASLVGAIALALATYAFGALVGPTVDRADFTERFIVRTVWCLLLQVPWCAAGAAHATSLPHPSGVALVLAAAAAVLPPLLFAHNNITTGTRRAAEALAEGRLVEARAITAALSGLGSTEPVAGRPPAEALARIDRQIQALEESVARPLPVAAAPAERTERTRQLALLGRLDEAADQLGPVTDVAATLLLAAVRQRQGRYADSSAAYRTALDLLGDTPGAEAGRVRAYDGLAFNARAAGRPVEAEAAYREGLERLPAAAAHFHFQLGRHHQQGGRPGPALEHLHAAARLDPKQYAAPVRPLIDQLERSTPGCLLRPSSLGGPP